MNSIKSTAADSSLISFSETEPLKEPLALLVEELKNQNNSFEQLAQSIGRYLQELRVQQGQSIIQIHSATKVSQKFLQALEQGQWHSLPDLTFTKGLIRHYGRILKKEVAPLVQLLQRYDHAVLIMHTPNTHARQKKLTKKIWFYSVLFFSLVIFLVGSLIWFAFHRLGFWQNATPFTPSEQNLPEKTVSALLSNSLIENPNTQPLNQNAFEAALPVSTENKITPILSVHFRLSKESWVEIIQQNNKTLTAALMPAGSEHTISGAAPINVVFGNASALTLFEINGKAFSFLPYIHKNVARFTLKAEN